MLTQRGDRLVVEDVGDRQVQRRVVDRDRHDAQVAGQRLGDERERLRVRVVLGEVDERQLELLGEDRDELRLVDDPRVHEDVAEAAAGALLLLERLAHLFVGGDPAGDEQVADAGGVARLGDAAGLVERHRVDVSSMARSTSSSGLTTKRTERPVRAVATSRATWSNGSGVAIVTTPLA